MRLIIFWRGETGLFFIAMMLYLWHIDCHGLNHAAVYAVEFLYLVGHDACLFIDGILSGNLL
jgi:hypothetical protein